MTDFDIQKFMNSIAAREDDLKDGDNFYENEDYVIVLPGWMINQISKWEQFEEDDDKALVWGTIEMQCAQHPPARHLIHNSKNYLKRL